MPDVYRGGVHAGVAGNTRMLVKPVQVVANLSTSRMVDDIAAKYGRDRLQDGGGGGECGWKKGEKSDVLEVNGSVAM